MGLARDAEECLERAPPQVLDLLRWEPVVPCTEVRLEAVVGKQLDELLGAGAGRLLDPRNAYRRVRAGPLAPRQALDATSRVRMCLKMNSGSPAIDEESREETSSSLL